jgi:hypothetical protein
MAQYRKAGMRTFYKVTDTGAVIKVLNKEALSQVVVSRNIIIEADATDPYDTIEITEAEFDQQFNLAKKRILNQEI